MLKDHHSVESDNIRCSGHKMPCARIPEHSRRSRVRTQKVHDDVGNGLTIGKQPEITIRLRENESEHKEDIPKLFKGKQD
jgi:hypothetical protein